eukprot:11434-Heterococcus_DN1.PRE.2
MEEHLRARMLMHCVTAQCIAEVLARSPSPHVLESSSLACVHILAPRVSTSTATYCSDTTTSTHGELLVTCDLHRACTSAHSFCIDTVCICAGHWACACLRQLSLACLYTVTCAARPLRLSKLSTQALSQLCKSCKHSWSRHAAVRAELWAAAEE